jgi:hypothetical protein
VNRDDLVKYMNLIDFGEDMYDHDCRRVSRKTTTVKKVGGKVETWIEQEDIEFS